MRTNKKSGTRLSVQPLETGNLFDELRKGWHSDPLYELSNLKSRIGVKLTENISQEMEVELTRLLDLIASTEEHISEASLNQGLVCMYQIGEAVGRLNHADYWLDSIRLSGRGIDLRKAQIAPFELARDACQKEADALWQQGDTRRVTAMAEDMQSMIFSNTEEFGLQCLPELETIKIWLREITPEHAREPVASPIRSPF